MGNSVYPTFDREIPERDVVRFNGRALGENMSALVTLSEQQGVPTLYEFFDNYTMLRQLIGDDAPLPENAPQSEQWYDPAAGLTTVRQLLTHLKASPGDITYPESVIADLQELEVLLTEGVRLGAKFSLLVDI